MIGRKGELCQLEGVSVGEGRTWRTGRPARAPGTGERSETAPCGDGASEPPHSALADSGGLVCLLDAVIAPLNRADLLVIHTRKLRQPAKRRGIAAQFVRVDSLRRSAYLA